MADCPCQYSVDSREKVSLGLPLSGQYRSPYLRDFIELALNTGCRKQELLGLEWRNVDFSNDLILQKNKLGDYYVKMVNKNFSSNVSDIFLSYCFYYFINFNFCTIKNYV